MLLIVACQTTHVYNREKRSESMQRIGLPQFPPVSNADDSSVTFYSPTKLSSRGTYGSDMKGRPTVEVASGTHHDCAAEAPSGTYHDCAAELGCGGYEKCATELDTLSPQDAPRPSGDWI